MRIIAGEFRGRLLKEPKFETTRPITDRAKQSLFDVLNPLIADATVYDCFSGTGSMGLECLSRGARHAVFFEADRVALAGLRENIKTLGIENRTTIMAGDIFGLLKAPSASLLGDLVFLDPPYRYLTEKPGLLSTLARKLSAEHMNADATLVFRHDANDKLAFPGFECFQQRKYGTMAIDLMRVVTEKNSSE